MIKLKQILLENDFEPLDVLKPRRSKEERAKNWKVAVYRQIQQYIKNGSTGDLDLSDTSITQLPDNLKVVDSLDLGYTKIKSLPDNLSVGGNLYLGYTPISKKYSEEEIRGMVPQVEGKIYL